MKNNFTFNWKNLVSGSSALVLLFALGTGNSFAQVNRYGALTGRGTGTGVISAAPTHCVKMNMLSNDRITDTEATLSWNPAITADAFKVVYSSMATGVATEMILGPGASYVNITGLSPAEQYKWYVETICASGNHASSLMKFTTLTTTVPRTVAGIDDTRIINSNPSPLCTPIGTVSMLDMGYNKAIISWPRSFTYDSIVVRHALAGTTNYKTNTISGTPNTGRYYLMGLAAQTSYDIWVSTYCNAAYSSWSAPITVTTLNEPAPRYMAPKTSNGFSMAPNPVSKETMFTFNCENAGMVNVNVYDITGKEVFNTNLAATEGTNEFLYDVSKMYKGIYMVKVSGNNINTVQRMIVQ